MTVVKLVNSGHRGGRITVLLSVAAFLFACGVAEDLQRGMEAQRAVQSELERWYGIEAEVGFRFHNGRLESVSIVLAREQTVGVDFSQLAEDVAPMVTKHFGERPDTLMISVVVHSRGH